MKAHDSVIRDGGSYFGGKGGSGVYQTLINQIPPHDVLVVPFAGRCAVTRRMILPPTVLINDKDQSVIDWWGQRELDARRIFGKYHNIQRMNVCGLELLASITSRQIWFPGRIFIYLDPPYPLSTRKSGAQYSCEMSDEDHMRLLKLLTTLNQAPPKDRPMMMISSYYSDMYHGWLGRWRQFSFRAMTRQGVATEHVWCNYEKPSELQDYRYLGSQKRERFKLERRRKNLLAKLRRLSPLERNALIAAAVDEFGIGKGVSNAGAVQNGK